MHYKVVALILVLIGAGLVYLHLMNPSPVDFALAVGARYQLPAAAILAVGFAAGMLFAIINSLVGDLRRAVKDVRRRREGKKRASVEANYRAGVAALTRGETEVARRSLEKALGVEPSDPDLYIQLAETYAAEGRHAEAVDAVERGLARNPQTEELWMKGAREAEAAGDDRRLEKALKAIRELDPDNAFALARLRDLKRSRGEFSIAVELQRKITAEAKRGKKAGFGEAASQEGLLIGLLCEAAASALDAGRHDEAMRVVRQILKRAPDFVPAHVMQGDVYRAQSNPGAAVRAWERGYEQTRDPVFFMRIEDVLIEQSEPETLMGKYRDALYARPGDVELRLLYARLLLRIELVDEAIAELERMAHDVEDSYYLDYLLGEAYLRRNQSGKAASVFARALAIDKDLAPTFRCEQCQSAARAFGVACKACGAFGAMRLDRSAAVSRRRAPERAASISLVR